jgi:hypothetical protein
LLSYAHKTKNRNAKVQEGEKPSEDPYELIKEMESKYALIITGRLKTPAIFMGKKMPITFCII